MNSQRENFAHKYAYYWCNFSFCSLTCSTLSSVNLRYYNFRVMKSKNWTKSFILTVILLLPFSWSFHICYHNSDWILFKLDMNKLEYNMILLMIINHSVHNTICHVTHLSLEWKDTRGSQYYTDVWWSHHWLNEPWPYLLEYRPHFLDWSHDLLYIIQCYSLPKKERETSKKPARLAASVFMCPICWIVTETL